MFVLTTLDSETMARFLALVSEKDKKCFIYLHDDGIYLFLSFNTIRGLGFGMEVYARCQRYSAVSLHQRIGQFYAPTWSG